MERPPPSLLWFTAIWTLVAFLFVAVPPDDENQKSLVLLILLLPVAAMLFAASNAARWFLVGATGIGAALFVRDWTGTRPDQMAIVGHVASVLALVLLFTPSAREWFRKPRVIDPSRPPRRDEHGDVVRGLTPDLTISAIVFIVIQVACLIVTGRFSSFFVVLAWIMLLSEIGWKNWRRPKLRAPDRRPCPFSVGQKVYYRPPMKVSDWSALPHALVPGHRYEIADIRQVNGAAYVAIKDQPMSGSGIHGSEFSVT